MSTLIMVGGQVHETVDEAVAAMTELGQALGATEPSKRVKAAPKPRLLVRFKVETQTIHRPIPSGGELKGYLLLRYLERVAFTPTGGKYIARHLLIRDRRTGMTWMGTMKKGTDVVKLRPAPKDVAR